MSMDTPAIFPIFDQRGKPYLIERDSHLSFVKEKNSDFAHLTVTLLVTDVLEFLPAMNQSSHPDESNPPSAPVRSQWQEWRQI